MNPKKIFDFIGNKNPKYELENVFKQGLLSLTDVNEKLIEYIDNTSEDFQRDVIVRIPHYIKYFNNPIEEVQIHVINLNPYNIRYIKEPTEKVQLMAI